MLDHVPHFEIALGDAGYPALLAELEQPPQRLYGIGAPESLQPGLAVVGARRATPYGRTAARILAGWAAASGYVIVSGGALGCDQAAHQAALDRGGTTVAVMGCGADVCYPRRSVALFERIAANGAIISEQPWGTEPLPWMFRLRNRIIAGLCPVLLVLEAGLPSGTFGTAEYALQAGRTVAAVPGSIFAPECRGSNRLIATGAPPVTDTSELRLLLELEGVAAQADAPAASAIVEGEDAVERALLVNPMRPDDVAREFEMDIVTVARALGVLEATGRIRRYPDGRYGPG
ncbi:MAG TPA: DNA-processing protein DprA [Coriobacteriia bacterium]|nr:DNA-processing protein DprA [Coriobacteriia bacterium]